MAHLLKQNFTYLDGKLLKVPQTNYIQNISIRSDLKKKYARFCKKYEFHKSTLNDYKILNNYMETVKLKKIY